MLFSEESIWGADCPDIGTKNLVPGLFPANMIGESIHHQTQKRSYYEEEDVFE